MDAQNAQIWVVLELTSKADGEDPDIIRASIRHHIRDAEVFIPASVVQKGTSKVYQYLVDGYAFLRHKHPEQIYARLEETKYVQGVLYVPTGIKREKKLATVTEDHIDKFRSQIKVEVDQGIELGDTVTITSGPYKNITAIVKEEIPEQDSVLVHIQLRSTDRLVTLPRAFLVLDKKSPTVAYRGAFEGISAWAKRAQTLIGWQPPDLPRLLAKFRDFAWLTSCLHQVERSHAVFDAWDRSLDFNPALSKWGDFFTLHKATQIRDTLLPLHWLPSIDFSGVLEHQKKYEYLHAVSSQISSIHSDLTSMLKNPNVPLNLVVDGTQLFIRCSEAPGLGDLKDAQGRPTGGIVGFLRSLGSYKKRFPSARIYVCWDGSSQRRKGMYPAYKGTRISRSGGDSFGWVWLRENLAKFGVEQAFNTQEEADDVMASLVRGVLKDQANVIISSDRDLLQLVTDLTYQLAPAMGAGKEKLYDPSLVESEYEVQPLTLVHLRALSGDSSDNISGVPGFGLKTAAKFIKMYGTVDNLLDSNLVGLSKGQCANLRECENQVRLNLELLKLRDVVYEEIRSNPNQTEAEARLNDLQIKSDQILAAFFPSI